MVAAVPQPLVEKYGHWADKIPSDVLSALTEDQVGGRLRRAQARWDAALGADGDGDLTGAMADAGEILAAPVPGAEAPEPSTLKAVGITAADMATHGRWISRIPDEVLGKMDRPSVVKRAEVAASEYARTGSAIVADRVLSAPADVVVSEPMTQAGRDAYLRGVREDIARQHGRWIAQVPDEVLGKLDAADLLDRCEHADGLEQRGTASPYPGMIHGYLDNAAKVLRALPAAEVDAEAARLEKAAMLSDYPQLAQGYLAQARALREANPQAPVKARPGVVGKALRPTPTAAPKVLYKAKPATPQKPAQRPQRTVSKADADPLSVGLVALEQALLILKNRDLSKADGPTPEVVSDLLDGAGEIFDRLLRNP